LVDSNHRAVNIIGAGNAAWHLAHAFYQNGIPVLSIWSRTYANALSLASEVGAEAVEDINQLDPKAHINILAVSDHALPEVIATITPGKFPDTLWAHTSGATSMQVFPESWQNVGVFYPLQTFTKGVAVTFDDIPVLINARDASGFARLHEYAGAITNRPIDVSDEDRLYLHLAAVWINNFVNHLGANGEEILAGRSLDRSLLFPLLAETINKIKKNPASQVQTGPAIRGDRETIYRHLRLMADTPKKAALYRAISESINPDLKL
jgi:predicted short-subunit dehydrogenase-like oxidoreductase (DUF2520 family)